MLLIENAEIYGPEHKGTKDILICGEKIHLIKEEINSDRLTDFRDLEMIDASELIAIPGFIDHHVHFNGAGGEGGPKNRTPPLQLSDLTRSGITSAVGLLGADGITRSLKDLLMKARALDDEGISTWIYTGSYQIPSPTITEDVITDIITVDKVIGVKIAVSDHRSSHPTVEDLRKIVSDARIGGMLAGDAGIVKVHVGDEDSGLDPLIEAVEDTDIPIEQWAPTHINRNKRLLKQSIEFAEKGGFVDITVGEPSDDANSGPSSDIKYLLERGVPIEKIKMSTDAGGSLPEFDDKGELVGMRSASPVHLKEVFKNLVKEDGVSIEDAVRMTSTNIAEQLRFPDKGEISAGKDADILLLDEGTLEIDHVIAKGDVVVQKGQTVRYGTYE